MESISTAARKTERNLGIEVLRLVSMLMIIYLHCVNQGGIFDALEDSSKTEMAAQLVYAACYGAVNLFALTTGYVYVKAPYRRSKIVTLWLEAFFYSVVLSAVDIAVNKCFRWERLLQTFFPVTMKQWWYFSSYFLLFFLMPLLNRLISDFSKRRFRLTLLLGFTFLCLMEWIGTPFEKDCFATNRGYSTLWLAYLYLLGAYLRIYETDFAAAKKSVCLAVYLGCTLLTWGWRLMTGVLSSCFPKVIMLVNVFYSYLSPTVVLGSVALLTFFTKLHISRGRRFLCAIAPCSFGVYLIHLHPFVWDLLIKDHFADFAQMPRLLACGRPLAFMLALFVGCIGIDYLRGRLFRALRIPRLSEWATEKVGQLMKHMIKE